MKAINTATEARSCHDRFLVVYCDVARELGIGDDDLFDNSGRGSWCLLEKLWNGAFRLVGQDGGEPEDQLLVRDWSWVCDELNRLSKETCPCESSK